MSDTIFLGGADANGTGHPDAAQSLILKVANRHGIVAGATGTGKTVTLQVMAQAFSDAGVPVFAADVKGDLSGICMPGSETHKAHANLTARAQQIGMDELKYVGAPTVFWDVFGETGHPIRATISEMGPLLLSRLMGLTDVQEGVLNIAFQYADDNGLLLLDLKDLRKLLVSLGDDTLRTEISRKYGNVAPASLSAVQRELLVLERDGAERFFGEPALELADLMRTTLDGRGYVNILDARKLINSPKLYSTFLLWLLSELFEELPEIGDPDKPRLVFFFDEAHLLFSDAPPALLQKIEQVVRLIRSKGVGVYFVTQNPRDLPESVIAQLGNRLQHALRAYTPTEQKAVKSAASSFRPNPAFKTEAAITEMGVGEALVSTLEAKGAPTMVQKTLIRPPSSRLGPATDPERAEVQKVSPVFGKYDKTIDRESAYEILSKREEIAAKEAEKLAKLEAKEKEAAAKAKAKGKAPARSRRMTTTERAANNAASTASREITRYILRGIFGTRKR
ncbi:MAG: ATP-binding protein [Hyphomonas sp.]|uniref:helicase HerA-like domain-containing protein n=1 Tax=Hyphomonas sp. TaxID=87 RepID=UPI0025BA1FA6|nr:helicase HerA-like domain-containing protein [Hyphomonas sp.]MBA4338688.1 ATP-binding protein [Hyphomonas sp.]